MTVTVDGAWATESLEHAVDIERAVADVTKLAKTVKDYVREAIEQAGKLVFWRVARLDGAGGTAQWAPAITAAGSPGAM